MPANIEIKARVGDLVALSNCARHLSNAPPLIIEQEDTFFISPQGRFKLRIPGSGRAQLIYYSRPDMAGPKQSDYCVFETDDARNLIAVLSAAFGVRGVVRKTRRLYIVGQTRIHLDEVEDLGHFVELEVVLAPEQSALEGEAILRNLMVQLGITDDDLVEGAYLDLMKS